MQAENKEQLNIINSIKAEGGYAKKWGARFFVGAPDLVCSLPGIGLFLLEAKQADSADVEIATTPKQKFEHEAFYKAGGLVGIAVILKIRKVHTPKALGFYKVGATRVLDTHWTCWWDPKTQTYQNIIKGVLWLKNDPSI